MPKELKNYRDEDFFTALHYLNQMFNTCMKMVDAGKKAEFDRKHEFLNEISLAYENLKTLHQKKVNEDAVKEINEETMKMF